LKYARIIGTGSYLPERVLTNRDLEAIVETSDAWITERTGIRERRIAADGETTGDMALAAAREALAAAGVTPGELDLIVLATATPDQIFPATACYLQDRLGANGCAAFDVQAVCSGFVYALDIVDKYVRAGGARRALVVGSETFSRILNWDDRTTCVLFGDGAGAVVVGADDRQGVIASAIHADGAHIPLLQVPGGVSRGLTDPGCHGFIEMQGNEVYRYAVTTLSGIVHEVLEGSGYTTADIDWIVPHQANIRIISSAARRLGVPMDKVVTTVDVHGNTSAASIPLALDTAVRDGRITPGQLVLFEALGGGFTWGAALVRM